MSVLLDAALTALVASVTVYMWYLMFRDLSDRRKLNDAYSKLMAQYMPNQKPGSSLSLLKPQGPNKL